MSEDWLSGRRVLDDMPSIPPGQADAEMPRVGSVWSQHTFTECLLCGGRPWASRGVGRGVAQMTRTWAWARGPTRASPGRMSSIHSFNRSSSRVPLPGLCPRCAPDRLCGVERVASSPGPPCVHLYNGGIRSLHVVGGGALRAPGARVCQALRTVPSA